ncbi:MAG: HetP family heterocyst commitment protein [Cyanobacteriota bacterium]|nr:HetP family heterocyst commitment protein [Cyanobacteriota bacterium]
MTYQGSFDSDRISKIMTREQYDQVVEAILAGKYSWACLLILRFGGYNPLHYMPYRTFNRLMKENRQGCKPSGHRMESQEEQPTKAKTKAKTQSKPSSLKIKELAHVSTLERQSSSVKGSGYYTSFY